MATQSPGVLRRGFFMPANWVPIRAESVTAALDLHQTATDELQVLTHAVGRSVHPFFDGQFNAPIDRARELIARLCLAGGSTTLLLDLNRTIIQRHQSAAAAHRRGGARRVAQRQ